MKAQTIEGPLGASPACCHSERSEESLCGVAYGAGDCSSAAKSRRCGLKDSIVATLGRARTRCCSGRDRGILRFAQNDNRLGCGDGWPGLCGISHLWVARPSVLEGRGFYRAT
jgi:hypothetical protein